MSGIVFITKPNDKGGVLVVLWLKRWIAES